MKYFDVTEFDEIEHTTNSKVQRMGQLSRPTKHRDWLFMLGMGLLIFAFMLLIGVTLAGGFR